MLVDPLQQVPRLVDHGTGAFFGRFRRHRGGPAPNCIIDSIAYYVAQLVICWFEWQESVPRQFTVEQNN